MHGTKDEYLVPEELVNDAWHFCERADAAIHAGALSAEQISTTLVLKQTIEESGDFLDAYNRSNIGELIEQDATWERLRGASQDVLAAFGGLADSAAR